MPILTTFWDAAEELDPAGNGDADERSRMPYRPAGELAALCATPASKTSRTAGSSCRRYESFEELWEPSHEGRAPRAPMPSRFPPTGRRL